MRPLTVNPNPTYQIPVTMTTYKAAIKTGLSNMGVQPVSGATTFNTAAVLTALLSLTTTNAGVAKWGGLNAWAKSLVTSLIQYFTENDKMKYGNARGSLIDNYGQYCGYCGTPVQDTALAIEHCLPKSEFPSVMIEYGNFFLCCPSCNSNKGSKPTYQMSLLWAQKTVAKPTIQQILIGGMQRQLWPNSDYAWRGFPPYLRDQTNKQDVPIQKAIALNNKLVGVVNNMVQASIPSYTQNPVIITAFMGTNNFNNQMLQAQETNYIDIVALNTYESGVYSDRRVTNRTVTWLNILSSLNNLNQFQVGSGPWQLMLTQVFSTAKNAGFYEIWASLFHAISPPSTGLNSVYLLFRVASANPNQPLYYFPGTNINAMPTT